MEEEVFLTRIQSVLFPFMDIMPCITCNTKILHTHNILIVITNTRFLWIRLRQMEREGERESVREKKDRKREI